MQAIGYVRVSTAEQAAEGVSLAAQRARIAAWAQANDAQLADIYTDAGLSGGRADNRPGRQAALDAACKAKAALVVYSLSRLARSTRDAITISERLDKAGADLVSLSEKIDTTTAAGKMVFRMLAVLAEFERDQVSERTTTAMQHKKARQEYTSGAAPYGWRVAADGVSLEVDDAEQEVLRTATELRANGASLRQIGQHLTACGLRQRNGREFRHPEMIKTLLAAAAA
jgi:DNA invertase Pin-like site-specific DNA recombinase